MNVKDALTYHPKSGIFIWAATGRGVKKNHRAGGIKDAKGYRQIKYRGVKYLEHRLAWFFYYKEWPAGQIDHIDQNPANNRIENLRAVSNQENHRNMKVPKDNTSGAIGVSWNKKAAKWKSFIGVSGVTLYLGLYLDWFDAVCSRKSAEHRFGFHPNHGRHEANVPLGRKTN